MVHKLFLSEQKKDGFQQTNFNWLTGSTKQKAYIKTVSIECSSIDIKQ